MQEKRRLCEAAYRRYRHFVTAFALDAYGRRAELEAGRETNIYFLCELEKNGPWKVGIADNPVARASQAQVSNPRDIALYAAAPATHTLEKYVHYVLRRERIRGEWFRPGPRTLVLADLFLGAGQMCADAFRDEPECVDSDFTIATLVGIVEDALTWPKSEAA